MVREKTGDQGNAIQKLLAALVRPRSPPPRPITHPGSKPPQTIRNPTLIICRSITTTIVMVISFSFWAQPFTSLCQPNPPLLPPICPSTRHHPYLHPSYSSSYSPTHPRQLAMGTVTAKAEDKVPDVPTDDDTSE